MDTNTEQLRHLIAELWPGESKQKTLHLLSPLQDWLGEGVRDTQRLADRFIRCLHGLEHQAVRVAKSGVAIEQPVDYKGVLKAAEEMGRRLSDCMTYVALRQRIMLKRAVIGLQYRLGAVNGGLNRQSVSPALLETLLGLATTWKGAQELLTVKTITPEDKKLLTQATTYPLFIDLLVNDGDLLESFFLWVLRDGLSVDVFIQYPALQIKIVDSSLNGRISTIDTDLLRIQKREVAADLEENVVTLPFEGKEISLLDERQVITFRGHYTLTIGEVFEIFKAKSHAVGDLELFAQGITNWNAHRLGWWDADRQQHRHINLAQAGWWKELPVTKTVRVKQAVERYGIELDGLQWVVSARATRSHLTLAPKGSHAFIEVAIPTQNGFYNIYTFGKFAFKWAMTALETLIAFTDNHYATVAYPDENIYFTNRQHASRPFAISPETGMQLMQSIKEDMLQSRESNFIYQWEGDNCAKWVQDKLEQHIERDQLIDLRTPMLESQPSDASRHLFALLRQLPSELHSPILSLLHYPLGAWRGKWIMREGRKVWFSLTNSHFWDRKLVYLPAMIHVRNEEKSISSQGQPNKITVAADLALSYAAVAKNHS